MKPELCRFQVPDRPNRALSLSLICLCLSWFLLLACDSKLGAQRTTAAPDPQADEIDSQIERHEEQLEIADQQYAKVDEQLKRYDAYLDKLEEQAARIDRLLDGFEKFLARMNAPTTANAHSAPVD